jgi:dUTP pyrophosphatase
MEAIELKIKKVRDEATVTVPRYMSPSASGLDICACIENDIILAPLERKLIPTGIAVSLPVGYEIQVRPRSGLALKYGITLLNSPGTIDADYRGEIQLIVVNLGNEPFTITSGMRLAQLVVSCYVHATPILVESLDETLRSSGGFGHTGI